MKQLIAFIFILTSAHFSLAKKKEHRHHESHVHGGATLNIAIDQLKGKVEFKAASEGILGFEHEPKSEKDKKKLNDVIAQFENGIGTMVKFDDTLGCQLTKEKIEMSQDKDEDHEKDDKAKHNKSKHKGEHSDFIANFNLECKQEVKGSKLVLDFSQFKGLKDLDVTLLIGDLQKSVEIKRKPVTIDLK